MTSLLGCVWMREGGDRGALALGLGCAVLAISTAAPVIRLADPLAPEVVACLRVIVTVVALGLVARKATASAARALSRSRSAAAWTLLAGLCLAAHFAAWIASLGMTSVVRSVALVSTQPLFAGLIGRALGDRD